MEEEPKPLGDTEALELAMSCMVCCLPASWIETGDGKGGTKLTPKAVRIRDTIADHMRRVYMRGRRLSIEDHRAGKR